MYIVFFSFSCLLHQFNEIMFFDMLLLLLLNNNLVFFARQLPSVVLLACLFCRHFILSDAAAQQRSVLINPWEVEVVISA